MGKSIDNEWLQQHLTQPLSQRGWKRHSPMIVCESGAQFSVQASKTHYCSPKEDTGPYVSVEVWGMNFSQETEEALESLSEDQGPCGWVPTDLIIEIINNEGGIRE